MPNSDIQKRPDIEKRLKSQTAFHSVGELDQLREFARGADLEITQLAPGVMHGILAHLDFGESSIHLNRFSLPARGRGSLSPTRWTFVLFPDGVAGRFNSQILNSEEMLVYPPNSEFEGTVSGSFHDWVFTIDYDELVRDFQMKTRRDFHCFSNSVSVVRPDLRRLRRLRSFADRTMAMIQQSPALLDDSQICRSLHRHHLELLSATLLSATPRSDDRRENTGNNWRIVRSAEDSIRANIQSPILIADLCDFTNTSERTLRRAFNDVVGHGPNAYLKLIRLSRIRAELEQATPLTTTVTASALRSGFFHLGRFSQAYKDFFGELPSKTLQRDCNP